MKEENIRLEYSSLLNQTNQFIFRQEAVWTIAHEYGHYLVRIDKEVNEFFMSRLEIEKLCWEKGKTLKTIRITNQFYQW